MLATLLLLMLEVPGRSKRRRKGGEKKDGQTTDINASDGNVDGGKGSNARCDRCGEVGHKMVRCPE